MAKKPEVMTAAPGIGHNSASVSGQRLNSFVQRIERLEEEKSALGDDVKDLYSEVKASGFEPKIVKKIVAERRKDREKLREEKELLELYLSAMGDPELAEVLS